MGNRVEIGWKLGRDWSKNPLPDPPFLILKNPEYQPQNKGGTFLLNMCMTVCPLTAMKTACFC
jgi:hypothetical protein